MTLRQKFKKQRLKLLSEPTPNKRAEVKYRDSLLLLIKGLKQNIKNKIKVFIELNSNATDAEILNFITQTIEKMRKAEILTFAGVVAGSMARLINNQNKSQIFQSLTQNQNSNPTAPQNKQNLEAILPDQVIKNKLDEYISKNVSLITSIKQDYLNEVEKAIRDNYFKNGHIKNIITTIEEKTNTAKARARIIARDQTNKLNADLTKERHEKLGINMYIWRTKGDERVRKTHFDMNNVLCRYDDDSVYSDDEGKTWKKRTIHMPKGKPGDEIQCRCRARAVIKV